MMDKVQKLSNSECYVQSSEPFRIKLKVMFSYFSSSSQNNLQQIVCVLDCLVCYYIIQHRAGGSIIMDPIFLQLRLLTSTD
jgi:hypothetical protein